MEDQQNTNGQPEGGKNPFLKDALMVIYQDEKNYGNLINLLDKGKGKIEQTVADATVHIVDKIEADKGKPLTMEDMQSFAPVVTMAIYELAEKAGYTEQDVTEEQVMQSFSGAFKAWAKKYPDRIDQEKLSQMVNSQNGQSFMQTKGQGLEQPQAAPAQAPQPQAAPGQGLLE